MPRCFDLADVTAQAKRSQTLRPAERALIEHVNGGQLLDLASDQPVDEKAMRKWDDSRTVRAWVVRDIMRGRLANEADPHGIQLRGARIDGRLDLENITSTVALKLENCFLNGGLVARDAKLLDLVLYKCLLEHPSEPPLDAERLTASLLVTNHTIIDGHDISGTMNISGARLGLLKCVGAELKNDCGPALMAQDLQVDQYVSFSGGFRATGTGKVGAVRLTGARIGRLICNGAKLQNDSGPAFNAERLRVEGDMFLTSGFEATGAGDAGVVRLLGAHLSSLEFDDAKIRNDSGPALVADQLEVDHNVFLRGTFEAIGTGELGTVRLPGARLGRLNCTGAKIINSSGPGMNAERLQVDQNVLLTGGFEISGAGDAVALDLNSARIGGALVFEPARIEHHTNPKARLNVDGLVYSGLPRGISITEWLKLLREGTAVYSAQPYQHLAAVHRAAGHDSEARRILMAQRQDQIHRRALTGRRDRAWARFTGLALGYGYQPWRALMALLTIVVVAVVLAVILGGHGGLAQPRTSSGTAAPECTVIERVGVGLDLGIPFTAISSRARCEATSTTPGQALTATGWVLRLLAWAFATLFIAGFTGAVRKT